MDNQPIANIAPFGVCISLANPAVAAATAAAMGVLVPLPCMPVTPAPWANVALFNLFPEGIDLVISGTCYPPWSHSNLQKLTCLLPTLNRTQPCSSSPLLASNI